MTMKVKTPSQALRRVKELKGRINTLNGRLAQSVSWVGDDKPTFEFDSVLTERAKLVGELVSLKAALMRTNCETPLQFGGTKLSVQQAVFMLAELKAQLELYRHLQVREGEQKQHVGHNPQSGEPIYETIQLHAALTEMARIENVESLEAQISELNDLIETSNHRTDLLL